MLIHVDYLLLRKVSRRERSSSVLKSCDRRNGDIQRVIELIDVRETQVHAVLRGSIHKKVYTSDCRKNTKKSHNWTYQLHFFGGSELFISLEMFCHEIIHLLNRQFHSDRLFDRWLSNFQQWNCVPPFSEWKQPNHIIHCGNECCPSLEPTIWGVVVLLSFWMKWNALAILNGTQPSIILSLTMGELTAFKRLLRAMTWAIAKWGVASLGRVPLRDNYPWQSYPSQLQTFSLSIC